LGIRTGYEKRIPIHNWTVYFNRAILAERFSRSQGQCSGSCLASSSSLPPFRQDIGSRGDETALWILIKPRQNNALMLSRALRGRNVSRSFFPQRNPRRIRVPSAMCLSDWDIPVAISVHQQNRRANAASLLERSPGDLRHSATGRSTTQVRREASGVKIANNHYYSYYSAVIRCTP
jgi:hypothetical protein